MVYCQNRRLNHLYIDSDYYKIQAYHHLNYICRHTLNNCLILMELKQEVFIELLLEELGELLVERY